MTPMGPLVSGFVKICGVTTLRDAQIVVAAGADAIGLNLWGGSPRGLAFGDAARLADAVRGRIEVVTVSVDADASHLGEVRRRIDPDRFQLHGSAVAIDREWLGAVYYAVGLADAADVERAVSAPGECVLIDARDDVRRGGTGRAPPANLTAQVCARRPTILAGGLTAENVGAAIARFAPAGVDAASGLERATGDKDEAQVRSFVANARRAFAALGGGRCLR